VAALAALAAMAWMESAVPPLTANSPAAATALQTLGLAG